MQKPPSINSPTTLNITAGNAANIAGIVEGDVNYYNYYAVPSPDEGAHEVNFEEYRVRAAATLEHWSKQYTLLDVERVVSSVGVDLEVIKGSNSTLREAVRTNRSLIILGGAGSGKSTSLKYLVYADSTKSSEIAPLFVEPLTASIFVDLTRFRLPDGSSPFRSILILLGEILHSAGTGSPPSLQAIQNALASTTLLIAFDSLDEVPTAIRNPCISAIEDLRERYPHHHFLMTSRQYNFRAISDWSMVALQPLRDDQVASFITKRLDAHSTDLLIPLLHDNPLRRLPLFLTYLTTLFEIGALTNANAVKSRSGLVHSYVEVLLNRDVKVRRPSAQVDPSTLSEALTSLAGISQIDGNSMRTTSATESLVSSLTLSSEKATDVINDLLYSGLLKQDGQYIRFSHQTVQAFFVSRSLFDAWKLSKRHIVLQSRFNKAIRHEDSQGAPVFLICHARGDALLKLMMQCLNLNPTLVIGWLEDLHFEQRESETTQRVVQHLTGIMLRSAQYSRFTGSKRAKRAFIVLVTYIYLFVILATVFALALSPIFYVVFPAATALYGTFIYRMWYARTISFAEGVFSSYWNLRDESLRAELVGVAGTINRSWLASSRLKALASAITTVEIEGRALSLFRKINSTQIGLQALGRLPDESSTVILKYYAERPNIWAVNAIQSLTDRSQIFPDERQATLNYLRDRYQRADSEWRVCKACSKGIATLSGKKPPKLPMRARLRQPTTSKLAGRFGLALFGLLGWLMIYVLLLLPALLAVDHLVGPDPLGDPSQRSFTIFQICNFSLLILMGFVTGSLIYRDARKLGAKTIYGVGWEGKSPLYCAIMSGVSPYFGAAVYCFYRSRLKANAEPTDFDALEDFVKQHLATSKD